MAPASTFTPKASLCDSPTNLKEAIDWVLRVTGRDGKALNKENGECICGLAAAVTDLLQSVQLEYNGYEGESKGTDSTTNKGATSDKVTEHLNELFSLVQGLGGTAVVRTYIDQLAQVLSALVGWSRIVKCSNGSGCGGGHGKNGECQYLKDLTPNDMSCGKCGCLKVGAENHHLGRGCVKCMDDKCGKAGAGGGTCDCKCKDDGTCTAGKCKCDRKCGCTIGTYRSAYRGIYTYQSTIEGTGTVKREPTWKDLNAPNRVTTNGTQKDDGLTPSQRRHQCARILLGSVCLIWSGLTYMYWTGKYHKSSPRWNNHILDGSGLDDGTLSQWLQALGFPRDMLNNSGPGNRLDGIINDEVMEKLFLGFTHPSGLGDVHDGNENTARKPAGLNYAGFVHTIHRDSFHQGATVFRNGDDSSTTDTYRHKCGALYKLYIISCAYFTGLQKKGPPSADNKTPRTIREILYWLSALPYSKAYKEILTYGKDRLTEVLKKPGDGDSTNGETQLKFTQQGRTAPITVDEYNLFAHFQAVTQYCPLVLIGIQGGIHSTKDTKEPAIHSLYANTECHFTYPTVSIQAYNQVVHYIRALFYQLYFLRKQCAVKVTCGGKWRECRYGDRVVSNGVISWMCLGCSPMEHDRKCRVGKVGDLLKGVKESDAKKIKELLEKIGEVVVQLGNAQEALEGKKKDAIEGVQGALRKAKDALATAKGKLDQVNGGGLKDRLDEAKAALGELTNGSGGKLGEVDGRLDTAKSGEDFDQAKNKISEAIKGVRNALEALKKVVEGLKGQLNGHQVALLDATKQLIHIVDGPNCTSCTKHITKCGHEGKAYRCTVCDSMAYSGSPSPLQAFLEDRLPGFSCREVVNQDENPEYPLASSHLGHCNGSGQCCPLPMGFRGEFHSGSTSDSTGARLYGILYFFSNENMMQSCVYTLVRVTAALSATTPQVLGDVFGFFRGGIGEKERGKNKNGSDKPCDHTGDPSKKTDEQYFCGWCASGLRDEVKKIEWIPQKDGDGGKYRGSVGEALINIKGDKGEVVASSQSNNTSLSRLTENCQYLSPLTGELYTAVSATFGNTYLSWVLYLSDALHSGLESLSDAFKQIECRGCKGNCDPNKCKKGSHGDQGGGQCGCQSIVSCTGVLPVLYRHGFGYGNPFNLEGYHQSGKEQGDYSIQKAQSTKQCHQFLDSLSAVIDKNKQDTSKVASQNHPLTELLKQVGKLQYDIRLPWIFVLTLAWLVAVLYLAFGAIWPLDWTHMRSHWLRGGEHQWQCMWYKVMTGRKGMALIEYFERR